MCSFRFTFIFLEKKYRDFARGIHQDAQMERFKEFCNKQLYLSFESPALPVPETETQEEPVHDETVPSTSAEQHPRMYPPSPLKRRKQCDDCDGSRRSMQQMRAEKIKNSKKVDNYI